MWPFLIGTSDIQPLWWIVLITYGCPVEINQEECTLLLASYYNFTVFVSLSLFVPSHMAFKNNLLLCTPLECETMEEMQASMEKAKAEGADLVELCLDSMQFSHISEVENLIKQRTLPSIVSFRYLLDLTYTTSACLFLFHHAK